MPEAVVAVAGVLVAVAGCVCVCECECACVPADVCACGVCVWVADAVWVVDAALHPCADAVRRRLFWSSFCNSVTKSANNSGSSLAIRSFFNSWHKPSSSCDLLAASFQFVSAA